MIHDLIGTPLLHWLLWGGVALFLVVNIFLGFTPPPFPGPGYRALRWIAWTIDIVLSPTLGLLFGLSVLK